MALWQDTGRDLARGNVIAAEHRALSPDGGRGSWNDLIADGLRKGKNRRIAWFTCRIHRMMLAAIALVALAAPQEPEFEMTTYWFALLKKGPSYGQGTREELMEMQAAHLSNFEKLHREGKLLFPAPLASNGEIRGIAVFDVKTKGDVMKCFESDPFITKKQMVIEAYQWYTGKGMIGKPEKFFDLEDAYLGILKRPNDAATFTPERMQEIQAGHMANISAMAEVGILALAGPLAEAGEMRGLFFFRKVEEETIRAWVAKDPAVAAKRLVMELHPMWIAKGVLPPKK